MNVLVTGGAGYIGSFTVRALLLAGHQVTVLDDLSTGHRPALPARAELFRGHVADQELLARIFKQCHITAVLHFAGLIDVNESVLEPTKYYAANFADSLVLLRIMIENGVRRIVFPSSAAVYGQIARHAIPETHPCQPISPYGRSKMMTEMLLKDFRSAFGLEFTILRCFNVAGASPDGQYGEAHQPENHLIPRVLRGVVNNQLTVSVFGTDYPTEDGTCVRDFVHVDDVAKAHVLALERASSRSAIYNLASETGSSVRRVVEVCEKSSGHQLCINAETRRAGDPATIVGANHKIRDELGWRPSFDLQDMIAHAWRWHSGPGGYASE